MAAGDLEWDCWETAEHVADDLFYYAAQLGAPGYPDYLPLRAEPNRPGGEPNTIRVVAEAGPAGLFTAVRRRQHDDTATGLIAQDGPEPAALSRVLDRLHPDRPPALLHRQLPQDRLGPPRHHHINHH